MLVTNDRDLLDLNKDEDKYFAPGVGLVKLGGLVNGHREDVWLVSILAPEVTERTGPAMEARGLYHIYREAEVETIALRGAALTLEPGTWTSVMGPSGSGKSTLVYVLAGLVEPSGGAVIVDGEDLTRLPPPARARWRRQRVGLVLQRDNLHPLLDVAENIELPLRLEGSSAHADPGPGGPTPGRGRSCRPAPPPGRTVLRRGGATRSHRHCPGTATAACCWPTSRPASSTSQRPQAFSTSSQR